MSRSSASRSGSGRHWPSRATGSSRAGHPTVHLIGPRAQDAGKPPREVAATGLLDHIAFTSSGLDEIRARLQAAEVPFEEKVLPRINNTQIFFHDPDGVGIELNFPAHETRAAA